MQAPMAAMMSWPNQPPSVLPTMAKRIAFNTTAPRMPRMMLVRSPCSDFMICSASHPAIAPTMIVPIQPTPSIRVLHSRGTGRSPA